MAVWSIEGGRAFGPEGEMRRPSQILIRARTGEDRRIRLREGDVLLPALMDVHMHLRRADGDLGVPAEAVFRSGVLAAADAGTRGWGNWVPFAHGRQTVAVRSWVSLLPAGLAGHPDVPPFGGVGPREEEAIAGLFAANGESLVGLKIRLGQRDAREDERLLDDGTRVARNLRVPLMAHLTGGFLPVSEVMGRLSPGDVATHVFHGRRGSILREDGIVPEVFEARRRGVIFDIGHGANHFSWRVFRQALCEGFLPDTISTDLTAATWRRPPVYSLTYVISKLLAAGLSWTQVWRGVFQNPSRLLGFRAPEDSAVVLREQSRQEKFLDAEGRGVLGRGVWSPVLMVARGAVVVDRLKERDWE